MPQQNSKPPIASTLATLAGCAIVFGSLLLTLQFPRLHVGIAIAIGAVLGSPFIILGIRLHERSISTEVTSKQFWPTRTEARRLLWGIIAFGTLCTSVFLPLALVVSIGFLLPPGDSWGIVTVRLLFVLLAILGWYWWVKMVTRTIPKWFRGRLSDQTLDALEREEPAAQPNTVAQAAMQNWQLVVIAIVALCVAFGVIDFDSPWLNIDGGSRRTRGFVRLIQWCRGNPNTVTSSAIILGTGASVWYIVKICRAAATPKVNRTDSRHVTKR